MNTIFSKKLMVFLLQQEDYLDLPLILSGCSSLEQSLSMSYIVKESLEGTNQYKCSSCRRHVDASKVCTKDVKQWSVFSLV